MDSIRATGDQDGRSVPAYAPAPATGKPATPIAVIGMACRLPGGIETPEQLWDALLRGDDLISEVPRDRWDSDEYYDPEPGVPGRTASKWGAFLDDVTGFDFEFFGLSEREATALDPQHRLLLETSWEAFDHAGITPNAVRDTQTGVFMGLTHLDYQLISADSEAMEGPYGFQGNTLAMAAGRIAYTLGLHGPALALDTACSSSLVAVHTACRSLNDGESDLALAGGAYVMLDPRKYVAGTAAGHLSPTGRCHSFDVAADGYVSGEACAVVLLKRLPDALRDGDRILAVVRGTAANQDGQTVNISTPSATAQTAVYRAALAVAGVDARTIGMIEAHGPGTPVGDPIEYASLSEVYGIESPCALGSVKSNAGHTQSASGALGLIKAILALQHGVVPRNLHFNRLPDEMARIRTNLFVPQDTTEWPTNGQQPRRAAVSSYGVSGTNVHAILEQAPAAAVIAETNGHRPAEVETEADAPQVFPLSSTSPDELRRTAGRLADWVQKHDDLALPDLAYTLTRRRAHRPVRTAVIASNRTELTKALRDVADSDTPFRSAVGHDDRGPVWVFSGQGSQWAQMGAELLAKEPVFAETVAQIEPLIAHESGFSVTEAITAPEVVSGIDRVQPSLFTMQVALAAAMKARGVRPGAVIGHSMGETAAAVVSGALSLEDGVRVICRRSRLMATIAGSGAMASVELPAKQVLSELTLRGITDVVVAVVASPQSTVIGGATDTVRELVAVWEGRDVMARQVAVDVASHSPQVDPILDELTAILAEVSPRTPEIPYYSATGFDPREEPWCNNKYWVRNLRNTVRFGAAVRAALEDGFRVFAELAPHPLLTHAIEQTADSLDVPLATLAGMRREQELPHGLGGFVADLHCAGAAIDFSQWYPVGHLVDSPPPTWTRRPVWLTAAGQDASSRSAATISVHPLLGSHVRLQEEPERHVWQAEVGTGTQPWLADHRIRDVAVLPGAAYCEMAIAAARTILGDPAEVRDVRFERTLLLNEQTAVGSSSTLSAPGVADFTVECDRVRQATAVLRAAGEEAPPTYDMPVLLAAHPRAESGDQVRKDLDQRGIQYGAAFAGLATVRTGDEQTGTVLAEVALPSQIRSQQAAYHVHPALLDACFQSVGASPRVRALGENALGVPLGVRRLRAYGSARGAQYCYTRVTSIDASGIEADLDILDQDGAVLLSVQGLLCGTGGSEDAQSARLLSERLLSIEWQQRQLPELPRVEAGRWLLIDCAATADAAIDRLVAALKQHGAQCDSVHWPHTADHAANVARLKAQLGAGGFTGVVIRTESKDGDAGGQHPPLGREQVEHMVRITRELLAIPGQVEHLFTLTQGAQTVLTDDVPNLAQTGLRGLLRVIGTEHPHLPITQIDVDDAIDAEQLACQLLSGSDEDETAWRKGAWYTARLRPAPLRPEERRTTVADNESDRMRLQIRTPGDLETLELTGYERIPPGPGQIEVAVSASSINFADVLVAMGLFPSFDGNLPELGMDFAGVVTAVGPDVTNHRVGDRVGGVSRHGCWATFVTCDADLAVPLPTGLSDHQAVAVATATATAWYGLHEQAKISAGDRLLIHSATGGVGQAAIAIAKAAGAEIFATAGTEDRRQLLRDMGIKHVYDSRSTEFAEQIRNDTDGYGVDIVLNSLTGAAQRAGFELLAIGGRFVEIGKRDVYGNTRLGLLPFHRNLTFYYLDLALMSLSHPRRVGELLRTVFQLAADGALPPAEYTTYPLADAATAIRVMSAAQHTGKLVLDIPRTGHSTVVVPPEQVPVCRPDGAYLITGGLGGLGLFLAEKMAAAGCGRIVLSSRSQPSLKTLETVELIRSIGADIVVQCGDISEPGTAQRLVAAATATGLPLRGVLHAAAVVEDATLPNITDELIERDWAPKVYGAWDLHQALTETAAEQSLDWFCSFSSAAALVGSPGQGAYAAANSWLDGFTLWRRAQGLPANAIAWGAWGDIGAATAFAAGAGVAIAPDDGAYAFDTLLRYDRAYTGYAPIIGAPWLAAFAERSAFAEAFRSTGQSLTGTSQLRAELDGLAREEWPTRLRRLVSDQISLILRRSIDPDRPLSEYGVDSLAALELRTRIETETGIRLSPGDLAVGTIRGLAELLCERLAPAEVG